MKRFSGGGIFDYLGDFSLQKLPGKTACDVTDRSWNRNRETEHLQTERTSNSQHHLKPLLCLVCFVVQVFLLTRIRRNQFCSKNGLCPGLATFSTSVNLSPPIYKVLRLGRIFPAFNIN